MPFNWCKDGNIIYCWMQQIHIPAWKYVVILGLDKRESDLNKWGLKVVLINSPGDGSGPKAWAYDMQAQIKIEQHDYSFLDNDHATSYIDCLQLFDKSLSEVEDEFNTHPKAEYKGRLKDHHYRLMRDILNKQDFSRKDRLIINTPIRIPNPVPNSVP